MKGPRLFPAASCVNVRKVPRQRGRTCLQRSLVAGLAGCVIAALLVAAAIAGAASAEGQDILLKLKFWRGHGASARCTCATELTYQAYEHKALLRQLQTPIPRIHFLSGQVAEYQGLNHRAQELLLAHRAGIQELGWNAVLFRVVDRNLTTLGQQLIPCGIWYTERDLELVPSLDRFDGCDVVMLTAITGAQDALPSAPRNTVSGVVACFVALLDQVTIDEHVRQGTIRSAPDGYAHETWEIVRVTSLPFEDPRKNSRIFKQLAPLLFPKALYSVWLDSKYELLRDPVEVVLEYAVRHGADAVFLHHHINTNVREEADLVLKRGLVTREAMQRQLDTYYDLGFTRGVTGLLDGAFIIRNHRAPSSLLLSCAWFNEINHHTVRDQLSFNYVLHRLGYTPAGNTREALQADPVKECLPFHGLDYYSALLDSKIHVVGNRCEKKRLVEAKGHLRRHGHSEEDDDAGAHVVDTKTSRSAVSYTDIVHQHLLDLEAATWLYGA